MPIAAVIQTPAAVVRPWTCSSARCCLMIAPAPRKPIPVTICAEIRVGSTIVRTDPTRIAAQIVTGIGFLGAGAIIRDGLSVRGLTTAATLWVVAAVGMACGAGYYWPAVAATVLTIITLGPLRFVARRTVERMKPDENRVTVELAAGQPVGEFLATLDDVRRFDLTEEADRRVVQLELGELNEATVARVADLPYVIGVRWHR